MTLLSICTSAAQSVGIAAPSIIVGNSDDNAVRLLALAQRAGKSLFKRANWTILQKEYTFPTVASTAEYDLPSDFDHFIDDTAWDRTFFWSIRGPLSPQEWQILKSGLATSVALRKRFRVKQSVASTGDKFFIDPTPSAVNTIVFEYVSNAWCNSASGTGQTAWAADTDVGVLEEYLIELELIWRIQERLGMAYQEAKAEADLEINRAIARDGGAPVLFTARRGYRLPPVNVPQTNFGS